MSAPGPSRNSRRAAIAVTLMLLLGILGALFAQREPPEIANSRALRLGMTQREAVGVMQTRYQKWFYSTSSPNETWLVFGDRTSARLLAANRIRNRLGLSGVFSGRLVDFQDWPVRVRLNADGRVDRIERGEDVELAGR